MPIVPAPRVSRPRAAARAAALSASLLLGTVLAGCEYEYDDGSWDDDHLPPAAAPAGTSAALPPVLPQQAAPGPVSGENLEDWVDDVLHDDGGRVLHTGFGSVDPGALAVDTTAQLAPGNYSLTVACRSTERVSFTVRDGDVVLLDLSLRCGKPAVNPVFLPADAALSIDVAGRAPANYACQLKGP